MFPLENLSNRPNIIIWSSIKKKIVFVSIWKSQPRPNIIIKKRHSEQRSAIVNNKAPEECEHKFLVTESKILNSNSNIHQKLSLFNYYIKNYMSSFYLLLNVVYKCATTILFNLQQHAFSFSLLRARQNCSVTHVQLVQLCSFWQINMSGAKKKKKKRILILLLLSFSS